MPPPILPDRPQPSPGAPDQPYPILPAAGYHWLTPWFDCFAALLGFGRSFKERVLEGAGLFDGARVLDVGCGTGLLALLVKQRYPASQVLGIDADPRILEIARRRVGAAGVEFRCARAEETGLDDGSIDAAVSTLAFHHIPARAKEQAARETARVLRPGGSFFLVDLQPLIRLGGTMREGRPPSTRMGLRSNTPEALTTMLDGAGLRVEEAAAPRSWLPIFSTFALRATKPG